MTSPLAFEAGAATAVEASMKTVKIDLKLSISAVVMIGERYVLLAVVGVSMLPKLKLNTVAASIKRWQRSLRSAGSISRR